MNKLKILEMQFAELEVASIAVVLELQKCWENTPKELEYIIGQLAELLLRKKL